MSGPRRTFVACASLMLWMSVLACAEPAPVPPPRLDDADLVIPGFDSLRVHLVDGAGEVIGPDGVPVVRAGLTEWRLVDDLDGDGRTDAVVVGWSSGGGSGTFVELVHFVLDDDGVAEIGRASCRERV